MVETYYEKNKTERLAYGKEYYEKNRDNALEYQRQYREKNRESLRAKARAKYVPKPKLTPEEHLEKQRARSRAYYHANRDERRAKQKEWNDANRPHLAAYKRRYLAENDNARIAHNIRNRIKTAMLNQKRVGRTSSAVTALGCTLDEFRLYIQQQFRGGMSWENYGEWHLDHIKPLCKYDLGDPNQYREACHYTNYQPLWGPENSSKGGR